VIEIHEGVSGPERLAKLLSGDYVASSLHKRGQNLQTLLLESDADTVLVQLSCTKIHFKIAKADGSRLWFGSLHENTRKFR
jgi:hypothetical protein